jgi:hypothetical protein
VQADAVRAKVKGIHAARDCCDVDTRSGHYQQLFIKQTDGVEEYMGGNEKKRYVKVALILGRDKTTI